MFKVTNAITFSKGPPNVDRSRLAAAVLDQAVGDFEKKMLTNDNLVQLGAAILKRE